MPRSALIQLFLNVTNGSVPDSHLCRDYPLYGATAQQEQQQDHQQQVSRSSSSSAGAAAAAAATCAAPPPPAAGSIRSSRLQEQQKQKQPLLLLQREHQKHETMPCNILQYCTIFNAAGRCRCKYFLTDTTIMCDIAQQRAVGLVRKSCAG